MPGVGDKLGRYTLLERLAVGGMGEVFVAAKAGPVGFGPYVALKVLRDELAVDQQFVDMLVDEANITKHLNHQNLVSVLDLGESEGSYYIAMEYVQGVTAERLIETLVERDQKLDVPLALHIGVELCRALKYAHSRTNEQGEPLGIIHRDVTPANILISTEGEVKLTDFGIARAKGRIHQTQAGVLKGKFGYMAPEMVRYEELDGRADLFCAGVALYLLASGRHPVAHASVMEAIQRYENKRVPKPSEANPAIPPELDAVLLKALEPRPDERWQTAAEMGEALQGVLLGTSAWRGRARGLPEALAREVRNIAPEVFGDVVPREALARLSADVAAPALEPLAPPTTPEPPAPEVDTDEGLELDDVERARRALREEPPAPLSFPDGSTDPRSALDADLELEPSESAAVVDATVPVESAAVGRAMLSGLGRDRREADLEWSEPAIDRTLADDPGDDDDEDGETVVGVSIDEVDGAPDLLDEDTLGGLGGDPEPPTVIPLSGAPSPGEEPDAWGDDPDPGATLLEGLDADSVRAAIGRLPSSAPLDRTIADDDSDPEDGDRTYVRAVDPADAEDASPHVAGPLRIVLGADGAPSLAARSVARGGPIVGRVESGPAEGAPLADARGLASEGLDVGTNTGRWMAGELGAGALEWGDEAAGRRAVATRNQPHDPASAPPPGNGGEGEPGAWGAEPAPHADHGPTGGAGPGFAPLRHGSPVHAPAAAPGWGPPSGAPAEPGFLARQGPLLAVFGVTVVLVGGFAWVWFMTELLWPKLRLVTEPPGAEVIVDGEAAPGLTPTVVTVAPGQRHRIELRAEGYAPALREVTEGIGRGRTYALEVALEREAPQLHIAPVPGRVLLDGEEVGRGTDVRLPPLPRRGQIRIRVEADGHEPYEVIFESAEKVPPSLDVPLESIEPSPSARK